MVARFVPALVAGALLLLSCGGHEPAAETPGSGPSADTMQVGPALPYSFDSLDSRAVSSAAFKGKTTVISFITTYDIISQAEVDFLIAMAKHDGERVNYAVVALQVPADRELVETYKEGLGIPFPVALADAESIRGGGPLGDVHQVPTTLIFDAEGRLRWRHPGFVKGEYIRAAMKGF